jgi:hypothetical protein
MMSSSSPSCQLPPNRYGDFHFRKRGLVEAASVPEALLGFF